MQTELVIAAILCLVVLCLAGAVIALRARAYRRNVQFDPKCDWKYDFSESTGTERAVKIDNDEFALPENARHFDTGFLELKVTASLIGGVVDPSIELIDDSERNELFFERGARGLRYLNVSAFLKSRRVQLRGRHLIWKDGDARLLLWRNDAVQNNKVLIIAPHADDAEIAAHALYAETKAHIVTICARNRARAWDSIHVPSLAGVSPENSVQLAYPDNALAKMHAAPAADVIRESRIAFVSPGFDFAEARLMNRRQLLTASCSWKSLVSDLKQILSDVAPTVLVLPFPKYDNHPDHGFTTLAVCEALSGLGHVPERFLLYINHALLSEHWPFGPAGTLISLPPNHDGKMSIRGVWSRPVSAEAQRDKQIALESMHDLREPPRSGIPSWREILRELRNAVGAKVHGMERRPNNYFRRAVRTNELFFVANYEQVRADAERFQAAFKQ